MTDDRLSSLDQSNADKERPSALGLVVRVCAATLVAGVFVAAGTAGIVSLHSRAAAEPPPNSAAPVAVATITARMMTSYDRKVSYVGRLEAARQTSTAFERAGLVTSVTVDEGDEVEPGKVIATLDTSRLKARRNQLLAQKRALEAQSNLAQMTLSRQSRLKSKGWSPDQRYDEAKSNRDRLAAEIDRVAALIAEVDIDIAKSVLKAPFAGQIAKRSIDEGAVINAGAPVVDVLETSRRQARIGLPPAVAATLELEREYPVRVNGRALTAKLIGQRPDLESGTRTVTTLFGISGSSGRPSMGELVSIELSSTVAERGVWVPLTALEEGRRGLWTVLVVEQDGPSRVVHPEMVELLYAKAGQAFVRGTVKDGAQIISRGTGRVVAGQRVALVEE